MSEQNNIRQEVKKENDAQPKSAPDRTSEEQLTTDISPRLRRNCLIAERVLRIMRTLLIVVAAFCAVSVFIALVAGEESGLLASERFTIFSAATGERIDNTAANLICQALFALSATVPLSMIIELCARCFRTVRTEQTPFVQENVRRIKLIALFSVIYSLVPEFVYSLCMMVAARSYNIKLNLGELFVAFIIWCVALIFEHGVVLQRREDETL